MTDTYVSRIVAATRHDRLVGETLAGNNIIERRGASVQEVQDKMADPIG